MDNNEPVILFRSKIVENTKITSGNYELVDSRSVIYFDSAKPIEVEEIFNNDSKIRIRIVCRNDETKERQIGFKADLSNNTVEYICFNFDNSLGTGTRQPIEIGTFNGKKLYLHFWIYAMGDKATSRKIEYSLWREK